MARILAHKGIPAMPISQDQADSLRNRIDELAKKLSASQASRQQDQDALRAAVKSEATCRQALLLVQADNTRLERQLEEAGLTPCTKKKKPS